eukprot:scaffold4613_cov129-Isochrysis_galbana.AAC.13
MLGTSCIDIIAPKTARAKQGAAAKCQHPADTTMAQFGCRRWRCKRALERGQCRVAFEGHANVFGPFNTNRVVM